MPTVSLAVNTTNPAANTPVSFTGGVTPATNSGAPIKDVLIDFGDGSIRDLGPVSGTSIVLQHTYSDSRTFTVTLTATDANNTTGVATAVVVIQPQTPVVTLTFTQSVSGSTDSVTFTANVTPIGTVVAQYVWDFGDGNSTSTLTNTVTHNYPVSSLPKTAKVTIFTTTNQTASDSKTVQ